MPVVLIVNGRLVDGTGNPWQYADIALDRANAREVVDATGQVVCPGFIDIQGPVGKCRDGTRPAAVLTLFVV